MFVIESSRNIPVVWDGDVVVVGGGPSGFIAAVASARNGARTLLLERDSFLGGMATAGLVGPISNFYFNSHQIINGIPWEFVKRIESKGGAITSKNGNIPFDPEIYKYVAQEMIEEEGCEIRFYSLAVAAMRDNDCLQAIILEGKSGRQAVRGTVFIDATGDGDLAFFCQETYEKLPPLQPMTLMFRLGGVKTDLLQEPYLGVGDHGGWDKNVRFRMCEAQKKGELPIFGGPWINFGSTVRPGEVSVNVTRAAGDGTETADLSRATLETRRDMMTIIDFLKTNFPEFHDCYLLDSATRIGVRETRRIKGKYILTVQDIIQGKRFPDEIARGCHPVDIHHNESSKQDLQWLDDWYTIPYRCLLPNNTANLLLTGRSVSAEKEAFASIRVQATCMALGQAAGTAASLSALNKTYPSTLPYSTLKNALADQGVPLEGDEK